MRFAYRNVALAALFGLALAAAGCSSNNKGKIEGRWKFTSIPGTSAEQLKTMDMMKMYVYVEFTPTGTMNIGAASSDPAMQGLLKNNAEAKTVTCKYKLLPGDGVEFYDMPKDMQSGAGGGLFGKKDRARTNVKIVGDNLTMTDSDGKTLQLTKVQ